MTTITLSGWPLSVEAETPLSTLAQAVRRAVGCAHPDLVAALIRQSGNTFERKQIGGGSICNVGGKCHALYVEQWHVGNRWDIVTIRHYVDGADMQVEACEPETI